LVWASKNGSWQGYLNDVLAFDAPTLLPNGTIVAIRKTEMNFVKDFQLVIETRIEPAGRNPMSQPRHRARISSFSSKDGFGTYDVNTLLRVAKFDWVGGGIESTRHWADGSRSMPSPPTPCSSSRRRSRSTTPSCSGNRSSSFPPAVRSKLRRNRQPTSTSATQLYDPPLTANGNRLFACEELDQDDCGKGDHREISLAWCQAQGYAKVSDFDVDSRKVTAETLNGQFCSKNKCKVFDSIACEM
jgi:hypothetical protein